MTTSHEHHGMPLRYKILLGMVLALIVIIILGVVLSALSVVAIVVMAVAALAGIIWVSIKTRSSRPSVP